MSPETAPPKLTRHRVTNEHGIHVTGGRNQRSLLILYRPAWKDLHDTQHFSIDTVLIRATRLLLGVVEMSSNQTGVYVVTTATAIEGYAGMLKAFCSGVACEDGVNLVDYLGVSLKPRWWSPYKGLRRRGAKTLVAFQRAHELSDDTLHQLIDRTRLAFLHRSPEALERV